MTGKDKKFLLMILDGWGVGDGSKADVISSAPTPNLDNLKSRYPNSILHASGENVGLPEGQMGNSEVGHLNIGAGRIIYQDLVKINVECKTGEIRKNKVLVDAFSYARDNNKQVHFFGLLSDGGVHSLDKHLYYLCDMTMDYGLKNVFIHGFGDGRDTDPRSGLGYMRNLLEHLKKSNGRVASFIGRYYAMDRDKRWERIKEAYDLIVYGKGKKTTDILAAIQESYDNDITDEFMNPIVVTDENGNPVGTLKEGDVVIFFNFRNDRARELTIVLTQKDMPEYGMHTIPLYYCTMTPYDATFKGLHVIYPKENADNTIGEVLGRTGKKQLRIAETEKYAHVTFFFSGGREEVFPGEDRILIPSPKVPTYDLKPEMSAYEVKDAVIAEINKGKYDFICLNFANGDMVGHTGVYDAIWKAVVAVDDCVGQVVDAARKNGYDVLIIADHGNADKAINEDGTPNTAHSLNPVPVLLVSDDYKKVKEGILADVAPTILTIMGIPIPQEMTGKILVE
ncbi:MAG TPA: 2,3-bisphosphoglycerate-independent phosphoglycerate mutase [Bacteroidales bacterium]|nr:2,3-bisphosphoglycerate-independent phosphoglycerate mutase [Bacteroidales bacterium]HQG55705.1 2,3-bisphosphoglycerate-independent phosphoglycerate mutase [Bacteroidales bacterium]HQK70551.1 2,3-bisphosphoglycerate-independent phosphoglycerate mutase [Bacteroidales bacterium]HRR16605.1 2,3-bisphosphoglycerate-independent phosphoglycerate mutase [Bacteroidales bacterium]HRT47890.1 2,3-bisphosphoglycerate-independent phosphoglycerate mutase [Bacteroidales bacterium]